MQDDLKDIDRLISLNDKYIEKIKELLFVYEEKSAIRLNYAFLLAISFLIINVFFILYLQSHWSNLSANTFFKVSSVLIVIIAAALMYSTFIVTRVFTKTTKSRLLQVRDDISLLAKHLYHISKLTSQLHEHVIKDGNVVYLLEVNFKLTEAEDLLNKVTGVMGVNVSAWESSDTEYALRKAPRKRTSTRHAV